MLINKASAPNTLVLWDNAKSSSTVTIYNHVSRSQHVLVDIAKVGIKMSLEKKRVKMQTFVNNLKELELILTSLKSFFSYFQKFTAFRKTI